MLYHYLAHLAGAPERENSVWDRPSSPGDIRLVFVTCNASDFACCGCACPDALFIAGAARIGPCALEGRQWLILMCECNVAQCSIAWKMSDEGTTYLEVGQAADQ